LKSESKTGLFFWWQASINSYAQIFFSKDELLGIACLLITFFNPLSGLLGLLGIVFGNLLSFLFISDKQEIQNGYWGFNHLMISLFLSFPYQFNFPFVLLFLSANLLCFAMTFWIKNWAAKWDMPYLSLPFIICAYIVMLAASSFPNISYSEKGIYAANELLRESVNPIVYFDEEILKFHLLLPSLF
jgi:urea transporter